MLKQIESTLIKEEFQCSIIQATEENPEDHLLVFLGLDAKEREQLLIITAKQQEVEKKDLPAVSEPTDFFIVQFYYTFPFLVKEIATSQVSGFTLFINQMVDFPGFEFNELENRLYYRYVWITKTSGFDPQLIMSIIGIISLFLELFSATFERLAENEITFNQLLEEMVHLAENSPDVDTDKDIS